MRRRAKLKNPSSKRLNKKTILITLITGGLISLSGVLYFKYQQVARNPQAQVEQKNSKETKDVVKSLGKILLLPSDNHPTIAKVEDVEKLKKSNDKFYKDIQKDDYLILYPDKAIIYRKKENKIINIAPIVDTSKSAPTSPDTSSHN